MEQCSRRRKMATGSVNNFFKTVSVLRLRPSDWLKMNLLLKPFFLPYFLLPFIRPSVYIMRLSDKPYLKDPYPMPYWLKMLEGQIFSHLIIVNLSFYLKKEKQNINLLTKLLTYSVPKMYILKFTFLSTTEQSLLIVIFAVSLVTWGTKTSFFFFFGIKPRGTLSHCRLPLWQHKIGVSVSYVRLETSDAPYFDNTLLFTL